MISSSPGETGRFHTGRTAHRPPLAMHGPEDLAVVTPDAAPVASSGELSAAAIETNRSRPIRIVQRIDDRDPERANRQAREDIDAGAGGIAIVFEGAPNAFGYGLPATKEALTTALDGIPFQRTHLRLDLHPQSRASVDWLVGILGERRIDPARIDISFGIDPAAIFAGTGRLRMSVEALLASLPQSLAHFFALGVPGILLEADGRVFHNSGATPAQELGIMLASAKTYLRMFEEARQPVVYAAAHIGFAISVDQDFSPSVAKLKALRRLWFRLLADYGVSAMPPAVHAETSYRMLTVRDPESNVMRNALACFAAMRGGADSISVIPHTQPHGLPDAQARRMARNTPLVMATEASVYLPADTPAVDEDVERLVDPLVEAAWAEYEAIEAEGGVLKSVQQGAIQKRVALAREARALAIREGELPIIGTTLHRLNQDLDVPHLPATPEPMPTDGTVFCERLPVMRLDEVLGEAA